MVVLDRIAERTAGVSVIGLGYVGLPLALRAAESGFRVTGLDTDATRVANLERCESPVLEISNDELRRWTESGRFSATDNPDSLAGSDIILICVPTPLADDLPDMRHVEHAAETVARYLKPGQLVVLESTTYPGTTDELLKGILETSGLKAGEDFYLGFSPERIDPGNETYGLHNVPKVIGGFDPGSTTVMEAFYGALVNTVVRVSSTRTAEMVKLLENTYRHVNIALANEMAILCHDLGIDVWEVIEAAATKPFGFQAFWPGPGWGGHCIPVDPSYLSWRVRKMGNTARFVDLAREFNRRMPGYVTLRISEILNEEGKSLRGSNVLILGVAYKPQVADVRESPALTIIEQLQKSGARVEFHDPYVESIRVGGGTKSGSELTAEVLHQADIVVLHTAHPVFDPGWISANSRLILDTRNYLKGMHGLIYRL